VNEAIPPKNGLIGGFPLARSMPEGKCLTGRFKYLEVRERYPTIEFKARW